MLICSFICLIRKKSLISCFSYLFLYNKLSPHIGSQTVGHDWATELNWYGRWFFSHSVVSDYLRSHELQHTRLPCPSPFPWVCSNSCPLIGDAIQPSHPLLSPFPCTFNLSQHQGLFQWVSSSHQVAKVLALQLQHQSFQWIFRVDFLWDGLAGPPCSPNDSQGSSPTPQFKSINSLPFTLVYGPTLTSVHDNWKNHSFDYMNLCQQSNACFLIYNLGLA